MKMESQNIYIKNIPRVSLRIALKQKQQKQTNKQTVSWAFQMCNFNAGLENPICKISTEVIVKSFPISIPISTLHGQL